ncbi:DNA (cytosine-5)-methyltransferase 1 [Litorimonas taeanensis]|uniref:Cytosine-specific methyltransferase n=1 Tax=Litorimonas taeanensis TaxID=568099 RepID=A0A420WL35_9PROT|nr:DNA cytosine methyltransferase [Litorimonas taeanensis]RKQ71724.1 DNA (cytosine-5)-methyltransferase 1 [Litorimonas taeanensis]
MSDSFQSLRKAAKLSLSDAADFLQISEEDATAYEDGVRPPPLPNVLALKGLGGLNISNQTDNFVSSNSNEVKKIKFIDLFAGIGGFHIALDDLGAKCVFAAEINPYARKTYEYNHKKRSPDLFRKGLFASDIKEVEPINIPEFDILCGGFPCQPFSQAGYKRGFQDIQDNRGNLFFDIINIIKEKKPQAYFLENVRHIKNHDEGKTFAEIQLQLEKLGYSFKYKMVKASDHGLPQHRPRIFMVGFKGETTKDSTFEFPEAEPLQMTMSDIFGKPCNKSIGYTLRVGGRGSGLMDRRNWDTYAVGGDVIRLSSKEGIKMMGLPSDFHFPVSETQAMKQLGNSVAVPAVKATARNIFDYINKVSTK